MKKDCKEHQDFQPGWAEWLSPTHGWQHQQWVKCDKCGGAYEGEVLGILE